MMPSKAKVTIYTKNFCPYCVNAKGFLNANGIDFSEVNLEENPDEIERIKNETGWRTFPIILINNKIIGGYTDMKELHRTGELEKLLAVPLKD